MFIICLELYFFQLNYKILKTLHNGGHWWWMWNSDWSLTECVFAKRFNCRLVDTFNDRWITLTLHTTTSCTFAVFNSLLVFAPNRMTDRQTATFVALYWDLYGCCCCGLCCCCRCTNIPCCCRSICSLEVLFWCSSFVAMSVISSPVVSSSRWSRAHSAVKCSFVVFFCSSSSAIKYTRKIHVGYEKVPLCYRL